MSSERPVEAFKNNPTIDAEFENDVHLVLEPARKRTLIEALDSLETIDEEFPFIDDLPPVDDVEL